MPYMQYLFCERCGQGANLDIDYHGTIESYITDGRANPNLNSATMVWDYLIYLCGNCGRKYKYTYREVEESVRKHLSSISRKFEAYLAELAEYNDNEDNRKSGQFFSSIDPELRKRLQRTYAKND